MKKIYLLIAIVGMSIGGYCQQGQWTWMNGDSVQSAGHYGIQGVYAPNNHPPSPYESCEWTDLNGNFWLFGGDASGIGTFCDLWEFKPSINQWAWIKGPGISGQFGVYGIQGIPSPTNNPGARGFGVATWVDTSGNFWLFGGSGYAQNTTGSTLNDLWQYNIVTNEWTWISGADSAYNLGDYGTILLPASTNQPPSRSETNASWVDSYDNLWLFGGTGPNTPQNFSDLWKYDLSINQWTWMKGSNIPNQPSFYGIKCIPDSSNCPSSRWGCYAKWKDSYGNFWLFGGADTTGGRNDLWRYNPITNVWTWMSGTNFPH